MDTNALELGWLETFLGEDTPHSGYGSVIAKRGEAFRRLARNGTLIDGNSVITFGLVSFPYTTFDKFSANTVQVKGNTVIAGLAGFIANGSANVISVIADAFNVGSNTTFLKDVELQAGASLRFSDVLTPPDVQIVRTGVGLLTLSASVTVNGALTVNGAVTVNGLSTLGNTIVNGAVTFKNTVTANSTVGTAGQILTSAGASANAYWAPAGVVGDDASLILLGQIFG